jgi:pimeloyl-ACP methyl ester carboxylesterase
MFTICSLTYQRRETRVNAHRDRHDSKEDFGSSRNAKRLLLLTRRAAKPMRTILISIVILALFPIAAVLASGFLLTRPHFATIGSPPQDIANVENVTIQSRSGATVKGWFAPGTPRRGAVLLLHGVRGDRLQMVERMRFLNADGIAVLAIDLQSHGESTGIRITFGVLESQDALSAVEYLRSRLPNEKIASIGVSLGGAATLLGPRSSPVDALVLESVYPDIDRAIEEETGENKRDWGRRERRYVPSPIIPLLESRPDMYRALF